MMASTSRVERYTVRSHEYIAAEFNHTEVTEAGFEFSLGDGKMYGGFHNKLLKSGSKFIVDMQVGYTPEVS